MSMIKSLLIANRGEIACRIIRTARAMGVRTIAVYSDADADALHVRQANEAVHIGPSPATESYLVGDKIIAAAQETGAQAIHPGYGFLSENADFAQAVLDAGLTWVGPKPESIRAMGLKDAAKKLMDKAGVPTTPGYLGDNQDADHLAVQADNIGYPVLIKAVAGGGGKGMRKVDTPGDFADALISCRREAAASFGNDTVILEKWIESPRHIEVQVFGDSKGNIVHLFERDCSLQRRHQKVIEEAPAPGMDETTRAAICDAAVRAAKAVQYENAGTIEFIADASNGLNADKVWFMEMNTRLQVEHPVTEEITGVDLVEWQLRVASGEPIPVPQEELSINGHAIEARLYAEDPANGFLPSVGRFENYREWPYGSRIETGVENGSEISTYYDPMIAKIIAVGDEDDRLEAIELLWETLTDIEIYPLKTNAAFLAKICLDEDFRSAKLDTSFIEKKLESLTLPPELPDYMIDYIAGGLANNANEARLPNDFSGFRLNAPAKSNLTFVERDGQEYTGSAIDDGGYVFDNVDNQLLWFWFGHAFAFSIPRAGGTGGASVSDGAILSPMPGKIIAVAVAEGDSVAKGDALLTLEAMKMEHSLTAPFDGVVEKLNATLNGQVDVDDVLIIINPAED